MRTSRDSISREERGGLGGDQSPILEPPRTQLFGMNRELEKEKREK